jgi:adenine-specific DNA-methyltransferase
MDYVFQGQGQFASPSSFVSKADDPDKVKRRTLAHQKQLIALTRLPQSHLKEPASFVVSEEHSDSVLFDIGAAEEWLRALDGQDHVTDFYIVAETKKQFESLKEKVVDLLGPQIVSEEERRSMSEGFPANLAYFKLEFLDKDRVALKQAFKEVLPMLWLKAGAVGPRPELPRGAAEPKFFDPSGANFAVLLDEGAFRKFVKTIGKRTDLRVVYIVTDADEAFKDMADEVTHTLRLAIPSVEVVQLYKDYLANFLINTRLDLDLNGQGGQA